MTAYASIKIKLLVKLLHDEAEMIEMDLQFLSAGAVLQQQGLMTRTRQATISKAWDDLNAGNLSAKQLLRCAWLTDPVEE